MEANKVRTRRSVAEKRRIVELRFQQGQSMARVVLAEGVNSHQVFQWRRAYRVGGLAEAGKRASSLLPVIVSAAGSAGPDERQQTFSLEPSVKSGAIHIEFPGRVAITVEHGADRAVLQTILITLASDRRLQGNPAVKSLRK
jgi:transposase